MYPSVDVSDDIFPFSTVTISVGCNRRFPTSKIIYAIISMAIRIIIIF